MTIARALGALFLMTHASLSQEVHFSPEERLDAIDAALIATAKSSIDLRPMRSRTRSSSTR